MGADYWLRGGYGYRSNEERGLDNEAARTRINHSETAKARHCKYCGTGGLHWNHDGIRWSLLYSDGRIHSCKSHSQKDHSEMIKNKRTGQVVEEMGDGLFKDGDTLIVIGKEGSVAVAKAEHCNQAEELPDHVNRAVEVEPPKPTIFPMPDDWKEVATFCASGIHFKGVFNHKALAVEAGQAVIVAMVKDPVDPKAMGLFVVDPEGRFEIGGIRVHQIGWVPRSLSAGQHIIWNLLNGGFDLRGVVRENRAVTDTKAHRLAVTLYFQQ